MLKIDKKYVDEFLGIEGDLEIDLCTPYKCMRMYKKSSNKLLVIKTSTLKDLDVREIAENLNITNKVNIINFEKNKHFISIVEF